MSREIWCTEKSQLLKTADNRIPVLNDIKDYISSLPHDEAKETTTLLQLPLVFDCLNDSSDEQIELACEVLTVCLSTLDLGDGTSHFFTDLGRALNHPHAQVKIMALNEILRDSKFIFNKISLVNFKTLYGYVVKCIGDENLSVATVACDVVSEICKTPQGINLLISQEVNPILVEVTSSNEMNRIRFHQVVINIAKISPDLAIEMEKNGFLRDVIDELNSKDVLVQLNIIELLSTFAEMEHGCTYLENCKVLSKLCDSLQDTENVVYLQLCEPGILKFFGHIAHQNPDILIETYPFVLNHLFMNLNSNDNTTLGVTLNTLSYIVDTDESKLKIDRIGVNLYKSITKIVEGLGVFPNDIKVKALHCLANFLNVNGSDRNVTETTRKWYGFMTENPMDWIMRYAKNPFNELKMGGLVVLGSLSKQYWGHEVMRNTPGLIEFLMDRNIETIKECKVLKYDIVKKLAESPSFNHEMQKSMKVFVNEGPFYVQGVTEIALEGDD
ncbi:26S proteasome non-ATPase regulatory subunit 5 [Onthophagus taurus]|uniref:26S proteasome non-ATPase regulatory subunit 5 n=1 Tax=Onthophagus taurus TaxID=166361 RepID=UPI0039BEC2A9